MKTKLICITFIILNLLLFLFGIEVVSGKGPRRTVKNPFTRNSDGTVTVYTDEGAEIYSLSGKFDISFTENGVVIDKEDGKDVTIQGGIIITEEK